MLSKRLKDQNFDRFHLPIHNQARGRLFTEDEDKFMLIALEKIGYGREDVYDLIKEEIRKCPLFKFDWFIRTRNSQEIAKRCHTLIAMIERESDEKPSKKASTDEVFNILIVAERQAKSSKEQKNQIRTEINGKIKETPLSNKSHVNS